MSDLHKGHRQRLRNSYLQTGIDGFTQVQTLELVLSYSIPRKDVNPVAHELLERFHNLSGVFSASVEELCEVKEITEYSAVLLKLIPDVIKKAQKENTRSIKAITNSGLAAEYLIPYYMFDDDEKALLLCLDSKKKVVRCEEISRGVVNSVDLNSRIIAETAMKAKACSVILSHNHPSGDPSPSQEDINATKYIKDALALIGIPLIDHIIISGENYCSFLDLSIM